MPLCPRPTRFPLALLLLALLLAPFAAAAHAVVVSSEPGAGAALADPPPQVVVRFNSRLDQERSRLLLIAPDGGQTTLPIAPGGEPTVLAAPLPATLAPGAWRLRWQVLAVDGHITRGDIPFTLRPR